MKKVKLIAVMLVLALALVGAGYAAWTDSAKIEGTVSTGEMTTEWEAFFLRIPGVGHDHNAEPLPAYVTAEAGIDPSDSKKAFLSIENLYPSGPLGEKVAVTGHVVNTGTIPVLYNGVDITVTQDDNDVCDYVRMDVRVATRVNGNWTVIYEVNDVSFNDLKTHLDTALNGVQVEVGDAIGFGENTLKFWLDSNAPNDVQGSTLGFEFEMNFKQFNM